MNEPSLWDFERHEPLSAPAWDERAARDSILRIVQRTEASFTPDGGWRCHPSDAELPGDLEQPPTPLYFGACGVMWALHFLQNAGAVELTRSYQEEVGGLLVRNRAWLGAAATVERASYLMGETPIELWRYGFDADEATAARLAALIAGNLEHPARELRWGSPGTLLAALFLHRRTGNSVWKELFRRTAARLRTELFWSKELGCHCWSQELYGRRSFYLGAVHGFAGTALPLIAGRRLLEDGEWASWRETILATVQRTATRVGEFVNWRPSLLARPERAMLMQICHGAPGFVVCLADFPGPELETLLRAAGEAVWRPGH